MSILNDSGNYVIVTERTTESGAIRIAVALGRLKVHSLMLDRSNGNMEPVRRNAGLERPLVLGFVIGSLRLSVCCEWCMTTNTMPETNAVPVVMVVDDEVLNVRLLEAFLLPMGCRVIVARNGLEAIEKVRESPPDVILLDIMMPKMNGFDVARRLKENPESMFIPIVMVTALQNLDDRVKALEAGADDFLTKPVDKTELKARVGSLLKVKAYNDHMKNYQQKLEVEVAKATEALRLAYQRITTASLETVHRLSRAAEYKDENTGAHIVRMSNYSTIIARKIGLSDTIVERILYAAPMHDVGKIGIPDHILIKSGRLTESEWQIMKQHTSIGAAILEGAEGGFIRLAEIIAMTHHERWDGRGYPHGLKGKEIPLVGRIAAIADVFDALTSKRPYKESFSIEKSLDIIKEGKGGHFEPRLVDAFLEAMDDILVIKEKYKDEQASRFIEMFNLARPDSPMAHPKDE